MTAPMVQPQPPPPPMLAPVPVDARGARPGGVTFACVLSIVLGAIGILGAFFVMVFASLLGLVPFAGPVLAMASLAFALPLVLMGVLGTVAGAQGLRGAAWARWTMVVLFAVGALTSLGGIAVVAPLAIAVVDVIAIVMLVNKDANAWFEGRVAPPAASSPPAW